MGSGKVLRSRESVQREPAGVERASSSERRSRLRGQSLAEQQAALAPDGQCLEEQQAALAPTASQSEPPTYDGLSEVERRALEDELDACAAAYKYILFRQRDAVRDLMDDALEDEEPSLEDRLLSAAAQVALTAALGPVGAFIGDAIAAEGARLATKLAAAAIADGTKKVVESGVDVAYQEAKGSAGDEDAKTYAFFRAQRDMLGAAGVEAEMQFIREGKETIRGQPDPMKEATRTYNALENAREQSYGVQETKSLSEWIAVKAKSEYGVTTDEEVAAIGAADLTDTSETGILGIEIEQVESPYDPGDPSFVIREMRCKGLHENLKAKLRGKRIGDLGVPCSINGTVHGYTPRGGHATGRLGLGRSENDKWSWNESNDNGTRFLKMYGVGRTIYDPEETDALSEAIARRGMAKLWESVEVLPVHNLE